MTKSENLKNIEDFENKSENLNFVLKFLKTNLRIENRTFFVFENRSFYFCFSFSLRKIFVSRFRGQIILNIPSCLKVVIFPVFHNASFKYVCTIASSSKMFSIGDSTKNHQYIIHLCNLHFCHIFSLHELYFVATEQIYSIGLRDCSLTDERTYRRTPKKANRTLINIFDIFRLSTNGRTYEHTNILSIKKIENIHQ